jgi:cephalosporin hydroxylase
MIDKEASLHELEWEILCRGPGMHKTDSDIARYQWILDTVNPTVVIETGLYYGGSLLWFAERVPRVITVEIDTQRIAEFETGKHKLGACPPNATIIAGNSHEVFGQVALLVRPSDIVMVSLDSDHDADTVYGEMIRYGKLVTPGSYMVTEDAILEDWPVSPFPTSPLLAINRYLAEHDDFEVDSELEDRWPTTQNPMGWLRRAS